MAAASLGRGAAMRMKKKAAKLHLLQNVAREPLGGIVNLRADTGIVSKSRTASMNRNRILIPKLCLLILA